MGLTIGGRIDGGGVGDRIDGGGADPTTVPIEVGGAGCRRRRGNAHASPCLPCLAWEDKQEGVKNKKTRKKVASQLLDLS